MQDELKIRSEQAELLLDKKFVRVYDLRYAEGRHYYDATRRAKENLVACMDEEAFQTMTADAVSCFLILKVKGREPMLLLSREYRYPLGRFVLSIPAGLIDREDLAEKEPAVSAAKREIFEETGLRLEAGDTVRVVSPLVFSTPGITDESNALVCAVAERDALPDLCQDGAMDGEMFAGFCLTDRKTAMEYLKNGRDSFGRAYSVYTWSALVWFVSGMWEKELE